MATLQFGDLPYAAYSERINREYCRRHGYTFEVIVPERQVERCPIWFKVKGVADLLRSADFVVYVDADAYFVDHAIALQSLIEQHMREASVLIGTDRLNKRFTFSDSNANSGVFVCRHTEAAMAILHDWWRAPVDENRAWLWTWPPEQSAFNQLVRARWSSHISLIPYFHMNGADGTFIRHLMGLPNYQRLMILRNEAHRLASG